MISYSTLYDPVIIISLAIVAVNMIRYYVLVILYIICYVIGYDVIEIILYVATDVNVYDVVFFGLFRVIFAIFVIELELFFLVYLGLFLKCWT